MNNWIFCKIISKEIPSYTIYEDEDYVAFLDLSQVTKGHTLVIPKKHFNDLLEVDDLVLEGLHVLVKKLSIYIKETMIASGINIINNNGIIAGQTVHHYHVHIIPRYSEKDSIKINFLPNNNDIVEVYEKLK